MANRTVMSQLTSVGESALEQLAASPVTRKALDSAVLLKDRVEKLLGDLVDVDGRIAELEKRVEALEKAKRAAARPKSSSSKPRAAARKPAAKSTASAGTSAGAAAAHQD